MAAEFAGQTLTTIGSFPLTNTFLTTLLTDGIIIAGIVALHKHVKKIPGFFQNMIEFVVDGLYGLTETVAGNNTKKIFPWFMGFFVFILVANWLSLFPGFETIGFTKNGTFIPFLKGATSDINLTLGLALVSAIATHVLAIRTIGIGEYLSRYFSLNPIFLFVGLLELVSEVTKIISLSFRLFGNIMAGEVVLTTVSKMFAFILPLPFISLEIIVGLVQALVFSILTMTFMSILMTPHHEGGEHHS
ncbi:MAG TPA: F0F1 ATP synthase subunit A [Patescibacteria group bacterium]|nr:F0F1 ATP synthase subunit A [Patescibacteria group bacterium]